jgi:hypothetical protein
MKLTPAQLKALLWVKAHQPVGSFPITEVRLQMVKKLQSMGLLEVSGKEARGLFSFQLYRLTEAGSAALNAYVEMQ